MSKQWVGQEQTVKVGEKVYTLSKADASVREEFLEWARPRIADPIDAILGKLEKMKPKAASLFTREALQQARARYDFASPEIQQVAQTEAGIVKMISLLLRKHHPDITDEEALDVGQAIGDEEKARMDREDSFRGSAGEGHGKLSSHPAPSPSVILAE